MKNMSDLKAEKPEIGNRKPDRNHVSRFTLHASRFTFHASGFTLLEVMVALSIIAIVLIGVYRMHAQTISMANDARFYTTAPLLAQGKLSELEMKVADELAGGDSGDFGDDFPGYTWNAAVEDVESEYLGDIAKRLKQIDLTVTYNDGEFTYGFRTYRLLDEEKG
ncbi:prepilin-type N-terminal cleavage/methylation domain-containing protein [Desulfococcaceae bacterium HSG8]|nr:prepilin-type N-terminal cleavage/methylation domain-containing protein [Desulfococcaceae bacterium HSG8]